MIGKGHTRIRKSVNQVTTVYSLVLLLGLLVMALARKSTHLIAVDLSTHAKD